MSEIEINSSRLLLHAPFSKLLVGEQRPLRTQRGRAERVLTLVDLSRKINSKGDHFNNLN